MNISDYDLDKDSASAPPPRRSNAGLIAVVVLIVAAIGIGSYLMRREKGPPQQAAPASPPPRTEVPVEKPPAVELPPLDETDVLVRRLAAGLSSNPLLASWLATDGVIRRFTVVVDNLAYGKPVRKQLTEVAPAGTFRTTGRPPRTDPRGYERYALITAAMDSIDPARAAQMYSTLRPRIEEAYKELGRNTSFDRTLERAIVSLLQAPPLRGDETLVRREARFLYANPQLESLTPAQKHLMRMGPEQAARVQAKLRELALALGIPRERLP